MGGTGKEICPPPSPMLQYPSQSPPHSCHSLAALSGNLDRLEEHVNYFQPNTQSMFSQQTQHSTGQIIAVTDVPQMLIPLKKLYLDYP